MKISHVRDAAEIAILMLKTDAGTARKASEYANNFMKNNPDTEENHQEMMVNLRAMLTN